MAPGRQFWESCGIPYNDDPVLAAAAELGNGAGIDLVMQSRAELMLEQKLFLLQMQYEMAIENWDRELKRANKAEKEVARLQKIIGRKSVPDPNPLVPGKFVDWSKEPGFLK